MLAQCHHKGRQNCKETGLSSMLKKKINKNLFNNKSHSEHGRGYARGNDLSSRACGNWCPLGEAVKGKTHFGLGDF